MPLAAQQGMERFFIGFASTLAVSTLLAVVAMGCSDPPPPDPIPQGGTGGTGPGGTGGGGTGGTGGSVDPELTQLSDCSGDALRGFMSFLGTVEELLRYADDVPGHTKYDIPDGVSYDTMTYEFSWLMDVDGDDRDETLVDGALEESTGANPGNLSNGISNQEVILVPWTWVEESVDTGAGKFSVVGLGEDTVRMIIIEETWYDDEVGACYVDVFSFQNQLDLADPSSERFAFMLGFTAETGPYTLENAWVTLGETSISVSGESGGAPLDFELDPDTFELIP
jgi:hypothetical protein